jgi:xanthine dehydrogenase accessory factor
MSFDLDALHAAAAAYGPVVRVVIAEVAGSTPREPGAAMLVWPGGQSGTIGGGALEWRAARDARALLAAGGPDRLVRHALGPSLGQCCGGAVTLALERWDAARLAGVRASGAVLRRVVGDAPAPLVLRRALRTARGTGLAPQVTLVQGWLLEPVAAASRAVWIWGAGHVGRALVGVLAPLPELAITWADTAPGRFPATVPDDVTVLPAPALAEAMALAPRAAHHLILTYSHALDLDLCHAALNHGFASAGVIGSATKRARFRKRLAALGHPPAQIDRIDCPIGAPSLGKHPQAIAVGVAAALLARAAMPAALEAHA